jgi:hypothetical protein
MEIRSKAEFFRLWNAGALGFKLRTWDTPEAAVASGVSLVGFRQVGTAGGGRFVMARRADIAAIAAQWRHDGIPYMICEAAPDEFGTLQGEVCRGTRGWEGLLGRCEGLRMRDAIARGLLRPVSGVAVLALLNACMSPPSRDDLDALFDLYPDATVEFTCYGEYNFERGRNTIFWEVRNY